MEAWKSQPLPSTSHYLLAQLGRRLFGHQGKLCLHLSPCHGAVEPWLLLSTAPTLLFRPLLQNIGATLFKRRRAVAALGKGAGQAAPPSWNSVSPALSSHPPPTPPPLRISTTECALSNVYPTPFCSTPMFCGCMVQAFDLCHFAPLMENLTCTTKQPLSAMAIVSPTSGRQMGSSRDDFDLIEGGYNVVVTNPALFRYAHSMRFP
jgi:hypothetical protein